MGNEWSLYERLLAPLTSAARVRSCLVGAAWTLVQADGVGMAMTIADHTVDSDLERPIVGRPLDEVATHLRSWNLGDASLGLAALNAHYNSKERVEEWLGRRIDRDEDSQVFRTLEDELAGKKVGVIGHFPGLERLAGRSQLSVFERHPRPGDLPDFAEEYLLPGMDWVFITGTALTNKTLPHLLDVTRGVRVVLVGPSVPLTPLWFELGVHLVAGCVVTDRARLWPTVQEGACLRVFKAGATRIQVCADDLSG